MVVGIGETETMMTTTIQLFEILSGILHIILFLLWLDITLYFVSDILNYCSYITENIKRIRLVDNVRHRLCSS